MRVVFMGTPDFAVPTLARLAEDGHATTAVYTRVALKTLREVTSPLALLAPPPPP